MNNKLTVSIIIPVRNERENLPFLLSELKNNLPRDYSFEILIIDDGSIDDSVEIAEKELVKNNLTGKIIKLLAPYGKGAALDAGIKQVHGELVIMMDADLQDDPKEIKRFIDKLNSGYDTVVGWRNYRKDKFYSVLSSKIFNFFVRIFTGVNLHDINCGLKAFKKETLDNLRIYKGLYRFIPIFIAWKKYNIVEIKVNHRQRKYGKSKYTFFKFIDGFFDLFLVTFIVRFAINPLRIYGLLGTGLFGTGFIMAAYLTILRLQGQVIGRRPLLIFAAIFIIGGLQLISLGFLGELIRMNNKNEPSYIIKKITTVNEN